ncbi:5-hydroxytryptamine receptor 1D-like [Mizuhopecten yessoensis]|uniref:Octopamine receptor n=1 Tax=Mizuhopecten yessoensis TaxID=6573 RepID=A0A210PP96_MIZYE|nr:5-hydroxytryptamine receptor 1D-like [Mizuhopecten yessoensis]OWF38298.1 Octopamine receptor [Mizuhopecten yessoensis]
MANLPSVVINSSWALSGDVSYQGVINDTHGQRNDSMATVSEVINYGIIVFGVFVITATILGNSLVILAIIVDKKLRRVGNIFIVNLAVSDILVGAIVSPLSLVYQITGEWPFGRQLCDLWISVDIICCTASILNLCVISYDRYNAISQPLKYAKHRTTRRALTLVTLVWLYSCCIALPPLLGWSKPTEMTSHGLNNCQVTRHVGYTFYSTIGAFYLPLCIMVCFYARIFVVTSSRGKQWVRGPGSSCRFQRRRSRNKRDNENSKVVCCLPCPCRSKQENESSKSVTTQTDRSNTRNSSLSSSIRRSTFDYSSTVQSDLHRKAVMFSPRASTASTSTGDVVLEITQGRRKQTIHRRLYRQISNPNSDSSYTTSTTTSTTAETSFSESSSAGSDTRTSRRASNVIYNLLAANIMAAEILRDSVKGVQFAPQHRSPLLIEEEIRPEPLIPKETVRATRRKRKNVSLPHEKRAVKTLGIVVGCFIFCWLPFFVVTIIVPLCQNCNVSPIVTGIVLWLGYCNSACNPIIYTFFNEDFRRAFKKLTTCGKAVSSPIYL